MNTYANRGMTLESIVKYVLDRYRMYGEAVITKQNTKFIPIRNRKGQVTNCKVDEKATVDFIGRCGSIPVAFEAKETSTNRISFNEVQDHQARFLDDWIMDPEAAAFVLVSFKNLDKFYAVPWMFWKAARDAWNDKDMAESIGAIEAAEGSKKKQATSRKCKRERICWGGITWNTPGKASVSPEELLPIWEVQRDARHGLAILENIVLYTGQKSNRNIT